MIGFGELRKKSLEWRTEISTVERYYALDWVLKGIYDRSGLGGHLTLRGASALSKAYFPPSGAGVMGYPQVEDIDFGVSDGLEPDLLERELLGSVQDAARQSGLQFRLHAFQATEARIEFTGPLGRRSAAQPLIPLRFANTPTRIEPVSLPLLHPFGDECKVIVRAVALEELAAERLVMWSQKPRARDVFDVWFILTHAGDHLDAARTHELAQGIAREKGVLLRAELDASYAPFLERAWNNALKGIPAHPAFETARQDIEMGVNQLSKIQD